MRIVVQVARVSNANQMMISIESSHEGLNISFADGFVSTVPWDSIREVHGLADVDSIEFDNPYEVLIRTKHGKMAEIPWDFAREAGEREYRRRDDTTAMEGQHKFGERLSELRLGLGLSQHRLSELSGVSRVTIARIEAASQSPRLETAQRLAAAMGYPIQALMMDDLEEWRTETQD